MAGGDDAVLLLHGLTGAPSEMHPLGRLLHRAGFTVHAPLLAGHGGRQSELVAARWRDWLRSANDAYLTLADRHERVHVGGICLGAMLSVALAAEQPVASVTALAPTFTYNGWAMPRTASARWLLKLAGGLPIVRRLGFSEREPFGLKDVQIRTLIARRQRLTNGGAVDRFPLGAARQLYLLADHVERIAARVTTPTAIFHARDDDMSHPFNAERLRRRLGGSASLQFLDDSYHMIHLDRELNRLGQMMTASLASAMGITAGRDFRAEQRSL